MLFQRKLLAASVCMALAGILSAPVYAQATLEEIIVTAQKREESLQEVPISIQAFSAEAIELSGIQDIEDISLRVPNLVLSGDQFAGEAQTEAVIRGLPGVGIYIDGVYQVYGSALLGTSMLDVEQISVLRGPQGTLFGRNTSGGAIQITTAGPDDEFGGSVSVGVGSRSLTDITASINMPISDSFKAKVSVNSLEQDGPIDVVDVGQLGDQGLTIGDKDQTRVRADFLWEPLETLSARLTYTDASFDQNGVARVVIPTSIVDNNPANAGLVTARTDAWDPFVLGLNPDEPIDTLRETGQTVFEDSYWQNREDLALNIDWELNDNLRTRLILSDTEVVTNIFNDNDGTSQFGLTGQTRWQQEAQALEWELFGNYGPVEFVLGYYDWDDESREFALPNTIDTLSVGDAYFLDIAWQITDALSVSIGGRTDDETNTQIDYVQNAVGDAYAAIEATDSIQDVPNSQVFQVGDVQVLAPVDTSTDTFKASLEYQFTEDFMAFVRYGEGYRAGGVFISADVDLDGSGASDCTVVGSDANGEIYADDDECNLATPYVPEEVQNVDIGFRSEWFDNNLRLNLTYFQADYDQIQLNTPWLYEGGATPGAPVPQENFVGNVATGEAEGFELEVDWIISDSFSANLVYGYTDAKYKEIGENITDVLPNSQFENTPEKSYTLGLTHRTGEFLNGRLVSNINYAWKDDTAMEQTTGRLYVQDAYGTLNARINWFNSDDTVQVSLYGNNLTDEDYFTSVFSGGALFPLGFTLGPTAFTAYQFGTMGETREIGASVSFNF